MKPFSSLNNITLNEIGIWIRGIIKQRQEDVREFNNLSGQFFKGRHRTDRVAPTAHNDVQSPDLLGDWVLTSAYLYVVVNDSGTLKWGRTALDTAW
jgi:hypothetical protein